MYDFERYPKDSEGYVCGKRLEIEKIARRIATENGVDYKILDAGTKNSLRGAAAVELCDNMFRKASD
jgi:hypothetical protein